MSPEDLEEVSTRVDAALALLDEILVPTGTKWRTTWNVVTHDLPDKLARVRDDLERCRTMLEDR